MQRMGMVIGIRPEKLAKYKKLHASPWPEMNALLSRFNIRNYSIFLHESENRLFGYWEYTGEDFDSDMEALGSQSVTKEWLKLCDPCQLPLPSRGQGDWWSSLEEVYHLD